MRSRWLPAALCLVAVAASPAGAQTKSSDNPEPPTEIAGKKLKDWIQDISPHHQHDPSQRENAIRTVVYLKGARDAAPALVAALRDRDASCRVYAALALIALARDLRPEDVENAVRGLAYALNNDPQAIVRFHSAVALSMFRTEDVRPVLPNLISQLRDSSAWQTRRAVVVALANAGTDNKNGPPSQAVAAIAGVLNGATFEESAQVRLEAAIALGAMGRPVVKDQAIALRALQVALRDKDKTITIWAHVSQMAIDHVTDDGLNAIAKHLKGKDLQCKVHAARALAAIGREAKKKIPDIIGLLQDKDPYAVVAALDALGTFGGYASDAESSIKAVMEQKDQNEYIKKLAEEALKKITAPAIKKPDATR
jgi:HEAT repeat protein